METLHTKAPRPLSIQDSWEGYRDKVIPADAPDIQISECQSAFYAGVHFTLQNDLYLATLPDDEGIKCLEALHLEMDEFIKAIKARG